MLLAGLISSVGGARTAHQLREVVHAERWRPGYNPSVCVPAHRDWYQHDLVHVIELLFDGKIAPAIHHHSRLGATRADCPARLGFLARREGSSLQRHMSSISWPHIASFLTGGLPMHIWALSSD
jgi:hypothetical protein